MRTIQCQLDAHAYRSRVGCFAWVPLTRGFAHQCTLEILAVQNNRQWYRAHRGMPTMVNNSLFVVAATVGR